MARGSSRPADGTGSRWPEAGAGAGTRTGGGGGGQRPCQPRPCRAPTAGRRIQRPCVGCDEAAACRACMS